MFKKLLSLAIVLGLAFTILLPSSFVYADEEEEDVKTEEEADAEDSSEEEADATDEEESESTNSASDESGDLSIYFYVIGFVVVLIIVMYAFTEGTRKK